LLSPLHVSPAERALAGVIVGTSRQESRPLVVLHPRHQYLRRVQTLASAALRPPRRSPVQHLAGPRPRHVGPGEEPLARAAASAARCPLTVSRPSPPSRCSPPSSGRLSSSWGATPLRCTLRQFAGVPVVALFGAQGPGGLRPVCRRRPCRSLAQFPAVHAHARHCPDALCMQEISVEQVARAADALLEKRLTLDRTSTR